MADDGLVERFGIPKAYSRAGIDTPGLSALIDRGSEEEACGIPEQIAASGLYFK
jgi:hypothetical protein